MNRLLITTAVALLLGVAPALSAEDTYKPSQQGGSPPAGQLPGPPGVRSEVAKQAAQPPAGAAHKAGGAKEQSSAPPSSGAASANDAAAKAAQSSDKSGGAKEQSSAPEGSSAADTSKPNPTLGSESSKE